MILASLLPWIFLFVSALVLIRVWNQPGPSELEREELRELREEVSLMRDFLADVLERIRRLESEAEGEALPEPDRPGLKGSGDGDGDGGDADRPGADVLPGP